MAGGGKPGLTRQVAPILVMLIVVVVGMALLLSAYDESARQRKATTNIGSTEPARLECTVTLIALDPAREDLLVRMEFLPLGGLSDDGGYSPNQDIEIDIDSATVGQQLVYAAGKHLDPRDFAVAVTDGDVADYPFDLHTAELSMRVMATKAGSTVAIPMSMVVRGSPPGMAGTARLGSDMPPGGLDLVFEVWRAGTVRAFAIFVMAAMWAISLVQMAFVYMVVFRGRRPEWPMVALLATLIFGAWALRNSLPGTPPVGTLSDFISFFWAEAITAIAIVLLIGTWVARSKPDVAPAPAPVTPAPPKV